MPYHGRGPLPASRDAKKPLPSVRERLFGMEGPRRGGNTWSATSAHHTSAVHPHACGEYLPFIYISKIFGGSSPRVWGILGQGQIIGLTLRFIPTRVGNTLLPCIQEQLKRFIPTRVGNTQWTQLCTGGPPVHPHACGEYPSQAGRAPCPTGSSPRVWGIPG